MLLKKAEKKRIKPKNSIQWPWLDLHVKMKFMAISKDVEKQWTHCRFPRGRDEELKKMTALQRKFPHQNCEKKNSRGVASNLPTPLPLPPLLVRPSVKHVFMLVKQRTC